MRKGIAMLIAGVCLSWPTFVAASPVTIGTMAQWAANPTQTIGDKNYVYLSSSGWNGSELLELFDNQPTQSHTLAFENLELYNGPVTMTVDYRIDITSSNVFGEALVDQDYTSGAVTQTLVGFASLADYNSNTPLFTLTANNTTIPSPTVFSAPFLQQMWFKETITLSAVGVGQLVSASNTVDQRSVPEIDPASTGSVLSLVTGALALLERRRRPRL